MPLLDPPLDAAALLEALYRRAHRLAQGQTPCVTVLHLGAERTLMAAGRGASEPSVVLTLALGFDRTARDCFRGSLPTALELEAAIAQVEDEVHTAHRRYREWIPDGMYPPAVSVDAGLHEVADLAYVEPGAVRTLSLAQVESLFNRLAAVVQGRPAAQEGLPANAAFAARLVVLRELMHHMPFASVVLLSDTPNLRTPQAPSTAA